MASPVKRVAPQRAGQVFRQETYYDKQSYERSYDLIIGKGIVLDIDYYGDKEYGRAPYSIKLKLDKRYDDITLTKHIPPLLPIHGISLPEVGEEVWVIFPIFKDYTVAFWISRVSYNSEFANNALNMFDYSDVYNETLEQERLQKVYGAGLDEKDLVEKRDISPNVDYKVPKIRIKPGDTVTHGRSNTHIINTFDTTNKKGVIDLVTEINNSRKEFYEQEFVFSEGSRVLLATKSNLDNIVIKADLNLRFHSKFDRFGKVNNDDSFVLLQSTYNRIISPKGGEVNHMVLAEKQRDWFLELLGIQSKVLQKVIDLEQNIQTFIKEYQSHSHPVGGKEAKSVIEGRGDGVILKLTSDINELKKIKLGFSLGGNITDLPKLADDIQNHISKHNACN